MQTPPKVELIVAPTPLHRLPRMSERLGIDLWIKRDDLTGFALGGNKGRKLEYLMAEALGMQAEVVVTCGSAQSNFVRQLGAACSVFGMRCAAAVMDVPYDGAAGLPQGKRLGPSNGNVLLDEMLGIDMRLHPDGTWEELFEKSEELAREYERNGKSVYRIPVGGSSPLGAYAFYAAASELEGEKFDAIVVASSSGSTHTGLAYAFLDSLTSVIGVACDDEPLLAEDFSELSIGLHELIGTGRPLKASDFDLRFDWVGAGYGVRSEAGDGAIELLARTEGIFLDPIYSGKAFAGLIDMAKNGAVSGRVLFWHTGGVPALFAS